MTSPRNRTASAPGTSKCNSSGRFPSQSNISSTQYLKQCAHNSSTSPDVTTFAREIPSGWVQQLRSQVDHGNFGDVVCGATDTSTQSSKANRRRLGNDGVCDGSKSTSIDEGNDNSENGLGVVGRATLFYGSAHAEDEQKGDIGGCAP